MVGKISSAREQEKWQESGTRELDYAPSSCHLHALRMGTLQRDVSNVEISAKLVEGCAGSFSVTNFTVPARMSETISSMKKKLHKLTGLPPDHQRVCLRSYPEP